jgi:hypothetical protein
MKFQARFSKERAWNAWALVLQVLSSACHAERPQNQGKIRKEWTIRVKTEAQNGPNFLIGVCCCKHHIVSVVVDVLMYSTLFSCSSLLIDTKRFLEAWGTLNESFPVALKRQKKKDRNYATPENPPFDVPNKAMRKLWARKSSTARDLFLSCRWLTGCSS